jgi:hypothetical protein
MFLTRVGNMLTVLYTKTRTLKSQKVVYEELLFFRLFLDPHKNELVTKTVHEEHYYKLWRLDLANKTRSDVKAPIDSDYSDPHYEKLIKDILTDQITDGHSWIFLLDLKDAVFGRSQLVTIDGNLLESNSQYELSRDEFLTNNYTLKDFASVFYLSLRENALVIIFFFLKDRARTAKK